MTRPFNFRVPTTDEVVEYVRTLQDESIGDIDDIATVVSKATDAGLFGDARVGLWVIRGDYEVGFLLTVDGNKYEGLRLSSWYQEGKWLDPQGNGDDDLAVLLREVASIADRVVTQHEAALAETSKQRRVELLHHREPDYACDVRVFVDGEEISPDYVEDLDPGKGYTTADWDEGTESLAEAEGLSPSFRAAALEARDAARDSEYVTESE